MKTTESIIQEMLVANTGVSCLDSGSAYGRHWQRNQGRDFESEPSTIVKFRIYDGKPEIEMIHNVYHWLKGRLSFSKELNTIFYGRYLQENDPYDEKGWLLLMEEFPEYLAKLREDDVIPDEGVDEEEEDSVEEEDGEEEYDDSPLRFGEFGGIYGEGDPCTINTYNDNELLSQVLQFTLFSGSAGDFIALQIHGGCDVRGGYTSPRIFEFGQMGELDILGYARGTIFCTGKDHHPDAAKKIDNEEHNNHYWYTDDGYHWYDEGSATGIQLEKYEAVDMDDDELSDDEKVWEPGKLFIKDGIGYCPLCGAKLDGSF